MPFLIGLEYATYRYLKLPAKYASHYSFISKPAECAVCFTDFTIQWIEDDQGRILCNDCAVRPVKKKIKKESQKQLKRTIISCFTKEYGNISKTYERRNKRKENVDPCDNETSPTKSQDQSKRTDEIEAASESIKESKSDEKCRNSSGDITLADEKNQNAGDKKEPVTEPASEVSNESENAEHEIPPKEINEPMETDNQDDDGGSILDQLSQGKIHFLILFPFTSIFLDDDQGDSDNDNKK